MDIFQRVRKWLATSLDIREEIITPASTLGELFQYRTRPPSGASVRSSDSIVDSLSPDSLDIVELFMGMDEEFGIEIPDEESDSEHLPFDTSSTVLEIVLFIERHSSTQN